MKRFLIPFLAALALPSFVNANVDPKIAEICMKATDFQGCVKSMSGQKENNLNTNSEYQKAITFFREGNSLKANKLIKTFLKKNPTSKEGWILKAFINNYEFDKSEDAIEEIDKALDIDDGYAFAHALKAEIFYFDLGGSFSKTLKYLKKGIDISPEDPHVNFIAGDIQFDNGFVVLGGDSFDLIKKSKDKKALSLKSFEEAKKSFEKTLANINLDTYKNPLAESSYILDVKYTTTALLGDTKFELYFLYKDIKERSKAKQYLEEALDHYSKAISMAPPQEEVENLELDRDLDLVSPADLYLARGNVYSFMNNKWKSACNDWKVSKKLGNEQARDNFRNFKC